MVSDFLQHVDLLAFQAGPLLFPHNGPSNLGSLVFPQTCPALVCLDVFASAILVASRHPPLCMPQYLCLHRKFCPTLCNPMDDTVHGILQAGILE